MSLLADRQRSGASAERRMLCQGLKVSGALPRRRYASTFFETSTYDKGIICRQVPSR